MHEVNQVEEEVELHYMHGRSSGPHVREEKHVHRDDLLRVVGHRRKTTTALSLLTSRKNIVMPVMKSCTDVAHGPHDEKEKHVTETSFFGSQPHGPVSFHPEEEHRDVTDQIVRVLRDGVELTNGPHILPSRASGTQAHRKPLIRACADLTLKVVNAPKTGV